LRIGGGVLLAIVVLGAALLYMVETHGDGIAYSGASPYNSRWDGTSNLYEHLKKLGAAVAVESWQSMEIPYSAGGSCSVILLVSPERKIRDAKTIADLVRNRGLNLVVLDEGPYSNDVLKALGLPIEIKGFEYVEIPISSEPYGWPAETLSGEAVPGFIELGGGEYYVTFFYVSPIALKGSKTCRAIAYTVDGRVVGALCSVGRSKVLVVGDGSIVTNAVIPARGENIYTQVARSLIESVCPSNAGGILVLLDASSYRLRPMTASELIERGYGSRAAILALNPFRYLYVYTANSEIPLSSIAGAIASVAVVLGVSWRLRTRVGKERGYGVPPHYGYGIMSTGVLVELCSSDPLCAEKVPCVFGKMGYDCFKELCSFISRNPFFKRKIVEKILSAKL